MTNKKQSKQKKVIYIISREVASISMPFLPAELSLKINSKEMRK